MSRRDHARGQKKGGTVAEGVSRIIPSVPRYWHRAGSSTKIPVQNVKTAVPDPCVPDTPTQAAPFTPARSFQHPSAPTSTRKVSASFSTDCPLSGRPTIAYSTVTASPTMNHPGPLTSHPVNQSSALSSSQSHRNMDSFKKDSALKTSHTYSNLPMPAAKYKVPSPESSVTTTRINRRALPGRNEENIPPSLSMANITTTKRSTFECPTPSLLNKLPSPKKKMTQRPGIPKSRTLSVFSNLTTSFSRTSLGQLTGNDSRRTSTSSKGTVRKDNTPYMNPQLASSTSSQALLNPAAETANDGLIYTAQSSAYWAGRFMALQDRIQSETLIPENMRILVNAHAETSLLSMTRPSLASSATTSCITSAVTMPTSPRKSQHKLPRPRQKSRVDTTAPKASQSATIVTPARSSFETTAALLVDEDTRARRVFMQLNALCMTSEARRSLQNWQQSYARLTGKEHLLPKGGTMREKTRELTWVGRLLIGSGGSHSKNRDIRMLF
ncbi:hypothetical protein F4859DRAFT_411067 [Xylaria cf. heliscus]|nr:hypothetical protein F4859DRAFT_411067 [Xylaria cf. heliscus]